MTEKEPRRCACLGWSDQTWSVLEVSWAVELVAVGNRA